MKRPCSAIALVLLGLAAVAGVAEATPGSGTAILMPSDPVEAGSYGTWVFDYAVDEPFDTTAGGIVVVTIPPGWTGPTSDLPVLPGHVEVFGPVGAVDSLVIRGPELWLHAGASPGTQIQVGDHLYVIYGTPPPAGVAQVQTSAPDVVTFGIESDPAGVLPAPLASGSPSLTVVPAPPTHLSWEPPALDLIAGVRLPVRLSARDVHENLSPVAADQLLSLTASSPTLTVLLGGVPVTEVVLPADSSGVWLSVEETMVGLGETLRAADGDGVSPALAAAVASVATGPGAAARLDVRGILDPLVAGEPASVTVEALDAHGNRATGYAGTVGFSSSDQGGATVLPVDYTFTPGIAGDGGVHLFAGELSLTTTGEHWVGAEDRAVPAISGQQSGLEVVAADASVLEVSGVDDPAISGQPSDVLVTARDPYGNQAVGYLGTIGFSSDDPHPGTVLPPDFAFTAPDSGRHRFPAGVILMSAGLRQVSAADRDVPLTGTQSGIDVLPGPAVSAALAPAGQVPVTVGATQPVTLTVLDAAGNPVPGEPATVAIVDPPDGTLAADPAHPGGTQGSASVQSGLTDPAGLLRVHYVAPAEAGRSDSLDAWTALVPAIAVDELILSSTAAGATRLAIEPAGAIVDTAFASITLVVEARDSFGNLDPAASPFVRLNATSPTARFSTDGGSTWSVAAADSLSLVAGTSGNLVRVREPVAGMLELSAADAAGFLATASRDDLLILPAFAAGTIALSVFPDTLTADGQSEATVTGGPVTDRYGNAVPDLLVTVDVVPGDVVAVDESPSPGIQRRTDAAGDFAFSVRAADSPAEAQISAASGPGPGAGTATGAATMVFDARVRLVVESLAPASATPGDTVAFQVGIRNLGPVAASFGGGTILRFEDPGGASYASTLTAPVGVPAGGVRGLVFVPEEIDPGLDPGRYTPLVRLQGSDARGAAIDTLLATEHESFAIEALAITAVVAPPSVSRGQIGVGVGVTLENLGDTPLPITDLGLDFSEPAYVQRGVAPPLPHLLQGREQRTYVVTVDVDPLATLGPVRVDARVVFDAGGRSRVIQGAAVSATWSVETAADVAYLAGSLSPRQVSAGQTHPSAVVVENLGGAPVILDPALTQLIWRQPGRDLVTPLVAATLVPGLGITALTFADLQVPADYPIGLTPVRLVLAGTENGSPYSRAIALGDSLLVEAPAVLAVTAGSVSPDSVSLGQSRSFSLTIVNSGGAAITLGEGTVLKLSGGIQVDLPLAGGSLEIAAAAQVTAGFGAGLIDPALGPGLLSARVEAATWENGISGAVGVDIPDPVVAELPAQPRWVAGSLAPARVTRGEAASFSLELANDGGATLTILPGSELAISDGVEELRVAYSGPSLVLPGGGTVSLGFPPEIVPAALAAQDYGPSLGLLLVEHGQSATQEVIAPAAELRVEAPADLRYVPGTIAPVVAVAGHTVAFKVRVENRGGAAARPQAATELLLDGLSVPLDMLRSPAEINGGAIDTLFFSPTLLQSVGAGVHQPSVEFTGVDWNGTPLSLSLAVAPDEVTVLRGAALRVDEFGSLAPRGARVNRSQDLRLRFAVTNPGEEAVSGATATLAGQGLAGPITVPLPAITGGDTAALEVDAIAAGSLGTGLVDVSLSGGVGATSGDPVTLLPALDDTLTLYIEREAQLLSRLRIASPPGATDGVASGGSLLDLEIWVENHGDAPLGEEGTVRLTAPAGYGILGPAEQSFSADLPLPFAVALPPGSAPPDSFVVAFVDLPSDLNSGAEAEIIAPRAGAAIEAVEPAMLAVSAGIVAPVNAISGIAFPGQTITVEATVANAGTAQASGAGLLSLTLSSELTLAPGEPADQAFNVGDPVSFRVIAAGEPGPPHAISVRITTAPPDENTGMPAAVEQPEATLSLATRLAAGELAGGAPDLAASTLVRGGAAAALLILTVTNPAPLTPETAIVLDQIAPMLRRLAVVEGSGAGSPVGASAAVTGAGEATVEEVVAHLELRRDRPDGAPVAAWTGSGEPVLVLGDTLAGQETRTYVLLVGASASAGAGTYRIEIGGAGTASFHDLTTGEPLPLILADGTVTSAPFTLYEGPLAMPNPFTPERQEAQVTYVLEDDAAVEIEIFTLLGDRVWSRSASAGEPGGRMGLNRVAWDGRNDDGVLVRNGVYHCRVRGGGIDSMVKIAAIR